jgi:hypothetical protein
MRYIKTLKATVHGYMLSLPDLSGSGDVPWRYEEIFYTVIEIL